MRSLGMDPSTYRAFSEWAIKADPNATRDAVVDAFDRSDYTKAKALAARFMSEAAGGYSEEELANAQLGEGLAVERASNGRLVLNVNGSRMLLRDAIRQGVVRVR